MGLWLKCPKCQVANPLDLKSCITCNASLENLPAAERVYFLGDAAPAAPKGATAKATAPKAAPKAAAAKTPAKAAPKKAAAKTKTKAAPAEVSVEMFDSSEPPAKRVRGPKALKPRH